MKAKRVKPAESPNPLYDATAARLARKKGEKYTEPVDLQHEPGEIVDDKNCWIQCMGADPAMVPHDDECRAKVASFRNSPKRQKFLKGLLNFYRNQELINQLSKENQTVIRARIEAYEHELLEMSGDTDPDE